ncbi:hypothetical protein CONLIGDRAFT_495112 [Coniochaeta ligniaria NRRL 30616]|uniref:Uncharacterized protein n=1 Tax=Coniochaeta ligniaria NRRL 30616 TaxID=1408157 RepID=A0A1J7IH68_9PEZI|nr:hypothetical protein CONLIGDRAFT_495112 [Coniochaeta ligniaria NRRL 30616]
MGYRKATQQLISINDITSPPLESLNQPSTLLPTLGNIHHQLKPRLNLLKDLLLQTTLQEVVLLLVPTQDLCHVKAVYRVSQLDNGFEIRLLYVGSYRSLSNPTLDILHISDVFVLGATVLPYTSLGDWLGSLDFPDFGVPYRVVMLALGHRNCGSWCGFWWFGLVDVYVHLPSCRWGTSGAECSIATSQSSHVRRVAGSECRRDSSRRLRFGAAPEGLGVRTKCCLWDQS